MIAKQIHPCFEDVLRNHNTDVKIHRLRSRQVCAHSDDITTVEVEVWRPIGSFQVILDNAEVARYGESGALDRCLRKVC